MRGRRLFCPHARQIGINSERLGPDSGCEGRIGASVSRAPPHTAQEPGRHSDLGSSVMRYPMAPPGPWTLRQPPTDAQDIHQGRGALRQHPSQET